jgi:uncharacterized iron-regulated protein
MQLQAVKHVMPAWKHAALGMEMFQRPFQGVLDDFAAKRIDEATLRSRSGWADRWGYDFELYGPVIRAAVAAHASLLALNAPRELTKQVVRHGLESLTPDEKKQVPQLVLDDATHRAWFDALMEDMGGGAAHAHAKATKEEKPEKEPKDDKPEADGDDHANDMPSADRVYTVQVMWDETMADTTAKWLAAHADGHAMILAGNGHCHDSAIVNRIKRRGIAETLSVHVVLDDGESSVAQVLAKPMNDFVVVLEPPKK